MPCCSCSTMLRVLENIPILGHLIAACYACNGSSAKAQRAALKSTVGILLAPVNIPAEVIDEATCQRCERLKSAPLTERRDWMKRHGKKVLRALCLPGSHSAGMYKITKKFSRWPLVDGWTRCQRDDIYTQLVGGVRFLDLRLVMSGGDVYVVDDLIYARGVTLKCILSDIQRFINHNPSEIIALHIVSGLQALPTKETQGNTRTSYMEYITDVDWKKVKVIFNEILKDRLIPEIMKDLVIGDIIDHGRNVFVCGPPEEASFGWNLNPSLLVVCPSDPSPARLHSHMREALDEPPAPGVLTWYRADCPAAAAQYAHTVGGVAGLVATRYDAEKFDFLEDLASAANWSVLSAIRDVTYIPFNVISTDFVHDEIIECIVKLNDTAEVGRGPQQQHRLDESMMMARHSSLGRLDESVTRHRLSTRLDESIIGAESVRASGVMLDESIVNSGRASRIRMDESIAGDFVDDTRNGSVFASQKFLNISTATGNAPMNTSFEVRVTAQPPLQIRDTTV